MIIKDLMSKDYLSIPHDKGITYRFLKELNQKFIISINNLNNSFQLFNKNELLLAFGKLNSSSSFYVEEIIDSEKIIVINENEDVQNVPRVNNQITAAVAINDENLPTGIIENIKVILEMAREWKMSIYRKNLQLDFYKKIFHAFDTDIFVTDEYGFIQYLNPYAEKVCGLTLKDCIGKHATDLEKEKFISSSITMEVIKTLKEVKIIQKITNTGKTILASAVPVFNTEGKLTNVVSSSRDVNEINSLFLELEKQKNELGSKEAEINKLKERIIEDNYIMESRAMKEIKETIMKVAPTDVSVLIQGETGSGKGAATDLIHKLSSRNDQPLIKINCGLIPENLLESELFGYEGGAFTGAKKEGKIGKIELADQGTIFLDEIGDMPLVLQVKILDFLQDREIVRVGGTKRIPINTRVVAATNKDLQTMVKKGTFREDLFYRLNVVPIEVKPLRNRIEDIVPLVNKFLQTYNTKYNLQKRLSPEVLDSFLKYSWPGNVRELMHVVERLVVISDDEEIKVRNLAKALTGEDSSTGTVLCTGLIPLKEAKQELEYLLVKRAYDMYNSTTKAGQALQIDQSTVVKIMKRYRERQRQ